MYPRLLRSTILAVLVGVVAQSETPNEIAASAEYTKETHHLKGETESAYRVRVDKAWEHYLDRTKSEKVAKEASERAARDARYAQEASERAVKEHEQNMKTLVDLTPFIVVSALVIWAFVAMNAWKKKERLRRSSLTSDERYMEDVGEKFGPFNPAMACPHCQTKGMIRTKAVDKKTGISGGKATAAVLTGGVSMLATGLSRVEETTQAHCEECKNTWSF
jgi:hypothetical protein